MLMRQRSGVGHMPFVHRTYDYPPTTATTPSTSGVDDADAAAGVERTTESAKASSSQQRWLLPSAPTSLNSIDSSVKGHPSDLEFFEDLVSEPVLVLGVDISHLSRQLQFVVCASGVFFFSLLYGYLQELISVQLVNRRLGLFLAMVQFSGYTLLAYIMRQFVYEKQQKQAMSRASSMTNMAANLASTTATTSSSSTTTTAANPIKVPLLLYLGLSLLRAVDLGMTNLAMQYINYPAKTLMKSSRVVFTMIFGVLITRKKYTVVDYLIVLAMVSGLALFMHADANSSAVFHHMGVIMLTVSLLCDGAITNMSESIMKQFGVGQDEFIFRMYSIALVAISAAAAYKGDLTEGMQWLSQPGTYDELKLPISERTWSVPGKIFCLLLFSSMGFFGSSCSAAITKNFGALTMSITSTARKATTLFLSFFLFNNVCTVEHLSGIAIFITALTAKSLRRRGRKKKKRKHKKKRRKGSDLSSDTRSASDIEIPVARIARTDSFDGSTHTTDGLTLRLTPSREGSIGSTTDNNKANRGSEVHVV